MARVAETKKKSAKGTTDSWTEFVDNLRVADQLLVRPRAHSGLGPRADTDLSLALDRADLWLTPKSVAGFDPAEFADLPERERNTLAAEVRAFLRIAERVPSNKPATNAQSKQARGHLELVIKTARGPLAREWIAALKRMLTEARAAAETNGWYTDEDEKEIVESLLDKYKAPRLRIRSLDKEAVLDPICRFGSGRCGVIDLVAMPTYETMYYVTFKCGDWEIASARGTSNKRPFTQTTFVNTIARLPHR
jgi:hypothetical protein